MDDYSALHHASMWQVTRVSAISNAMNCSIGRHVCVKYGAKIFFRAVRAVYIISILSTSRHALMYCRLARGFVFYRLICCEDPDISKDSSPDGDINKPSARLLKRPIQPCHSMPGLSVEENAWLILGDISIA